MHARALRCENVQLSQRKRIRLRPKFRQDFGLVHGQTVNVLIARGILSFNVTMPAHCLTHLTGFFSSNFRSGNSGLKEVVGDRLYR